MTRAHTVRMYVLFFILAGTVECDLKVKLSARWLAVPL